ncbi:MAG: hypothetical protein A2X48_23450 [Lentisphaerae bacterium GWF2_49_21]|nr:MAG: hypothetical protein A2X48_23450 [Lentisphaerae bacterium GWF2_49_21]
MNRSGQKKNLLKRMDKCVGVCTHFQSRDNGWKVENLLPLIQAAGIKIVRQEIHWHQVEKKKGIYKIPEVYQEWVDKASDAGLGIIMLLCYGNPIYENPLDPSAFAKYAKFMAGKLKDRNIIAYEIWNEPTNFRFYEQYGGSWSGKSPSLWRDKFCELLAMSAKDIREEDAETPIITNTGEPQFFNMIENEAGSFKHVDGVSHHPYPVIFPPETIPYGGGRISSQDGVSVADDDHSFISLFEMTRRYAEEHLKRGFKTYATEFGFSTFDHSRHPGWPAGYRQEAQAAYIVRSLVLAFAAGVQSPCIYDFMDDGTDRYNGEHNFGLIMNEKRDYEKKQSYHAVRRLIGFLGDSWTHLEKPPANLIVERTNPKPALFWQAPAQEPFLRIRSPQAFWFDKGDSILAFVWMGGRIGGEFNDPLGKIIWERPPRIMPVEIRNLVTGEKLPVKLSPPVRSGQFGERIILDEIPVGGAPIAIRWKYDR